MYSNNIVNFYGSATNLNVCTKNFRKLIEFATYIYIPCLKLVKKNWFEREILKFLNNQFRYENKAWISIFGSFNVLLKLFIALKNM